MDMSLFILPDAVFGQTPSATPVGGMHAEVLQPNPVEENDLPWWHTIDEMIANLPVDESQKTKLKTYAEAISDPDNAPGYMADVGGIDGDVLRIVTTGARKIARQKAMNASMDKSMTAAQMMRETVRKAGGEGSRGGKIIARTRTGRAVYEHSLGHRATGHFTSEDHHDAAGAHSDQAVHHQMKAEGSKDKTNQRAHGELATYHKKQAQEHLSQARNMERGAKQKAQSK